MHKQGVGYRSENFEQKSRKRDKIFDSQCAFKFGDISPLFYHI